MENNKHSTNPSEVGGIESIKKEEKHYSIEYVTGEVAMLNILNDHVVKFYMSPTGEFLDNPVPNNSDESATITAKSINDFGYEAFEQSTINDHETHYAIHMNDIQIEFDKIKGTMKIHDKNANKDILIESDSLSYENNKSTQTLIQRADEYFFGGGMQNGRYSHKGKTIEIANTNKWDDGGVSSPCPFYWSSYGYGVLRHTWQPGTYDFGSKDNNQVITSHDGQDFDVFIFINKKPSGILKDYYELTGEPVIMPEYAYYEAHLNAFNRDYWVEVDSDTPGAIRFEDDLYYKSYKPKVDNNTGILESLNGENDNYQFSARAMIDRYKKHDMPLGWFVPNDGYGCGYGQTDSLEGDIENLKEFTEYSLQNGVQVGVWTESNLHPKDPLNPQKGERDLNKEVGVANVVALKCDVAWIGSGYSFGLNAVETAANTLKKNSKLGVRPMIITVNGWAGTQRYSGIWSGDQTGGDWEYIRFHIPSYIGAGLSGQPIVGSDMDGIYGGGNINVNIRDYQWKTFTPLQLNMDGWGRIQKTPFCFVDTPATSINKAYLKLKSMLMPYNYTLGHEARLGMPMVRAMFLEFPDTELAHSCDCQYQFMWGPYLLVAPVYNNEEFNGDSVRHGIYLPGQNQVWIDFFTGLKYQGGKLLNNFTAPLWQIPVFVKDGSIIPMTNSNNNPFEIQRDIRIFTLYPNGLTSFDVYEDDGITSDYLENQFAMTTITMNAPPSNKQGELSITINQTTGSYKNMVTNRSTLLQIMASSDVETIEMTINGESVELRKVENDDDFEEGDDVFYFKTDFTINPYLDNVVDCDSSNIEQMFLLIKIHKMDVTTAIINISIKDYVNDGVIFSSIKNLNEDLSPPNDLRVDKDRTTSNSIEIQWDGEYDAQFYEIDKDGHCYTNIQGTFYLFENLKSETTYCFKIRSVNEKGNSEWSNTVIETTTVDPLKFVICGVRVTCNHPTQLRYNTIWDNIFNNGEGETLKLTFDLSDVCELDRIEYRPNEDDGNGLFLVVQYTFSDNGIEWSEMSDTITFDNDYSAKTITLDGKRMRYIKFNVLDSVDVVEGASKRFLFFKSPK